jgi:hypothetical protein
LILYSAWELAVLRFFLVFLNPSGQVPGQHLKLGHDNFLPHNSQFIIKLLLEVGWDSSVSKMNSSGWENHGLVPPRTEFLFSPPHPDWLWSPFSLPLNGYQEIFSGFGVWNWPLNPTYYWG